MEDNQPCSFGSHGTCERPASFDTASQRWLCDRDLRLVQMLDRLDLREKAEAVL